MLGVFYLILAWIFGYYILKHLLPQQYFSNIWLKTNPNTKVLIKPWMIIHSSSFLIGTIAMTWLAYIFSYAFRNSGKPMLYGNIITFLVVLAAIFFIEMLSRHVFKKQAQIKSNISISQIIDNNRFELIFLIIATTIISYFMFRSFNVSKGNMYVGFSVYSDFGTHLAMIRSFSTGANFPTELTHFPNGTMRYHFMFQFLVGNLEYLGLRIDWAMNLPSIVAMITCMALLYTFAVQITGKKAVGILTVIMFFFRSSFAFFTFIAGKTMSQAINEIMNNTTHIGKTPYEEWGLWAQKTLINQRHFPMIIGILILTLIMLYPVFYQTFEELKKLKEQTGRRKDSYIKYLFGKKAWLPENYIRPIFIGIILGMSTFWNGAVIIAALLILLVMAIFSKCKLEYAIIAVITIILSVCETTFFFGHGNDTIKPNLIIGFVASQRTLTGITAYYIELLGIFPLIIIAGLFITSKSLRWLSLAFLMPFIFANVVQLAPDITINEKYVFLSVILLNIIAANFIYKIYSLGRQQTKVIAGILIGLMLVTGVVDLITLNNIDKSKVSYSLKDPLTEWTRLNTLPKDIILTDNYLMHPILLAGRMIYFGWGFNSGSAGYNTQERSEIVNQMYGAQSPEALKKLLNENNIKFIVVDKWNRDASKPYKVNEDLIKSLYPVAYSEQRDELVIYKVN